VPKPVLPLSTLASGVVSAYLEHLAAGGASRVLLRQRRWALREAMLFAVVRRSHLVESTPAGAEDAMGRQLTAGERTVAESLVRDVTLGEVLADGFPGLWLAHADAVLRGSADPVAATGRARLASLRALATFAGAGPPVHSTGRPALRAVLDRPEVDAALKVLTQRLPGRGPDDHVRLAAVLAVMAARPMRSQELSALRVMDLQDRGTDVVIRPPGLIGSPTDDLAAPIVLRGVGAARLRDWLAVRSSLAAALEGGPVRALWTSIRSNSRPGGPNGSLPLPPGMPLKPRGLQRAYARSVVAANPFHPGVPGFPLPRSLDLLRRSLQELGDH
jgi:hypothetical protein